MPPDLNVNGGKITTPVGTAPLFPVLLLATGGYIAWYAIHYWRDTAQKWPSDPLKSFLTGKGLPAAQPSPAILGQMSTALASAATSGVAAGAAAGAAAAGAGGSAIATDALKYVGQGYVYGGPADRPGNWDCSSFVSYVLGHDLGIPLPGGHWGDPGFPPNSHGPTTTEYLVYGSPINRGEVQAGDLIVWADHIAIATSTSEAISAHSPSIGTTVTGIDAENAYHGGNAHYRRVTANPSSGSSSSNLGAGHTAGAGHAGT